LNQTSSSSSRLAFLHCHSSCAFLIPTHPFPCTISISTHVPLPDTRSVAHRSPFPIQFLSIEPNGTHDYNVQLPSVLQREVGKYEIRFDDDCAAVAGLTSKIQKLVKFVASGKSCHQPEINYVQPILTYITFYALYLAREMGFDNTQYPHVHKDSKSEKR
jgi:hypothetical protein